MKKLTKNKKTVLIVGAGALALLAYTALTKTDRLTIHGFDPQTLSVHFNFNGREYVRSVKGGAFFANLTVNKKHTLRITPADELGNVQFLIVEHASITAPIVKELASINIGQFYKGTPGTSVNIPGITR